MLLPPGCICGQRAEPSRVELLNLKLYERRRVPITHQRGSKPIWSRISWSSTRVLPEEPRPRSSSSFRNQRSHFAAPHLLVAGGCLASGQDAQQTYLKDDPAKEPITAGPSIPGILADAVAKTGRSKQDSEVRRISKESLRTSEGDGALKTGVIFSYSPSVLKTTPPFVSP